MKWNRTGEAINQRKMYRGKAALGKHVVQFNFSRYEGLACSVKIEIYCGCFPRVFQKFLEQLSWRIPKVASKIKNRREVECVVTYAGLGFHNAVIHKSWNNLLSPKIFTQRNLSIWIMLTIFINLRKGLESFCYPDSSGRNIRLHLGRYYCIKFSQKGKELHSHI